MGLLAGVATAYGWSRVRGTGVSFPSWPAREPEPPEVFDVALKPTPDNPPVYLNLGKSFLFHAPGATSGFVLLPANLGTMVEEADELEGRVLLTTTTPGLGTLTVQTTTGPVGWEIQVE